MTRSIPNVSVIETKEGDIYRWAPADLEKPRDLTPEEKIAFDKRMARLGAKAEHRELRCWKCLHTAKVWVRSVDFDHKGEKAELVKHAQVSSDDYPGPVPGFCISCLVSGPRELAEAIYWDRPEIQMGVRPTRWSVLFTDGNVTAGDCVDLSRGFEPRVVSEKV